MFQVLGLGFHLILGIFAVDSFVWATDRTGPHPAYSPEHPITEKLEGPQSRYTQFLLNRIKNWGAQGFTGFQKDSSPVQLQCLETPNEPHWVGLHQEMKIKTGLSEVVRILDDMGHYQKLFPGYDDIHVVSRENNKFQLFWEQHVPLFFVPNVTYLENYLVDKTTPGRVVYRYQLLSSQTLKTSDGLIVVEKDQSAPANAPRTLYSEFDFFNANWGALETFAPGKIWSESVKGFFLSDIAILLKAENPDWSYKKISEEGEKILDLFPIDSVLDRKRRLELK